MTKVYLSEAARKTVLNIANARYPESTAFVVLQDAKTDTLIARIVSQELLSILKTRCLGELIPNVEIHTFGLEKLTPDIRLELHFLPLHQTVLMHEDLLESQLNFLLEVRVRSEKPVRQMARAGQAG